MDDVSGVEGALLATERQQLDAFLEDGRDELLAILAGLSDDQARRRLVSSLTSPLAIVKHVTFVEQVWFHVALGGESRAARGLPDDADDSWHVAATDSVASMRDAYAEVRRTAVAIAARRSLDDVTDGNRRGPLTVRWIYLHMIRELARHAGHGDILREQILGADR